MSGNSKPRIAYFGHNRRDTAFTRRIHSFLDAGIDVATFTFRRDGEPKSPGPAWENTDLGHIEHANFFRRVGVYLRALQSIIRNRESIRGADVIYARNLDIFLFALLATSSVTIRRRSPHSFVYECLDVHEALTAPGAVGAVLRWAERRVLKKADLLVISSPGFINHYFCPTQRYGGPYFLVENKLYFGDKDVPRVSSSSFCSADSAKGTSDALTIGWIGIIRCQRTLDLLKALAVAQPEDVFIRIVGSVSSFLIEDFEAQIASIDNIVFEGPYDWPEGLAEAYRDVDLVWAQELSWSGFNSDWLIPNRVYEASYFGVPSLGVGDTETSRIITERRLGYVLPEESAGLLIDFICNLDPDALEKKKRDLLNRPATDFVTTPADTAALLGAIDDARRKDGTN